MGRHLDGAQASGDPEPMWRYTLGLGLLVTLFGTAATAGEPTKLRLADKKQKAKVEQSLSYYTGILKKNCGLKLEIDWASFIEAKRFDGPSSTVASACQPAIQAAAWGCEGDPDFKAAMAAAAGRILCVHVTSREQAGLQLDSKTKTITSKVVIEDTGATSKPAAYFAWDDAKCKGWFDKNL